MTSITTNVASKLAVAFVAAAMVVSAFAPAAQAQTTEELQQMINDLLAQVAALQAGTGQGATSVASGVCPYTWTRDLSQGSTGADVMKLQQFLNADADTRVAAEGAGSVGMETEYYGSLTAAAVSKMQVKYRAEVLSPAGLVNPTGYFGPSSRAKANSVCTTAPVVVPGEEDEEEEEEEEEDVTLGGEAVLNVFEIDAAADDEIEEGASDAVVAEVTVEFEDGDAEISRLDVSFSGGPTDAYDVLDTVSLWVDGDKVAEVDASDEDDFLSNEETLRFTGLSLVAMEDEDLEIVIAVTLQGNIDSNDLGVYDVAVTSMRYFDADGVATTETNFDEMGDTVEFEVVIAGVDDEVIVRTASSDPDSATLQLEDDKKSGWLTVFAFDLDTDDSKNDIEFDSIPVTMVVANDTFGDIVSDLRLVVDGQEFDDWSIATGTSASTTVVVEFDLDGDLEVDAGDRVTVELQVEFKALAVEGATIQSSVSANNAKNIDAEGVETITTANLSGAATGDLHTLRSTGIAVDVEDTDAKVTTGQNALDDYATFTMELEVTAFEQNAYISVDPATSLVWELVDGAGVAVYQPATSTSVTLTSTGDESVVAGFFEIAEGETETVTISVTYTPTVANTAARLQLTSIEFDADGIAGGEQTFNALPATNFRTAIVTIVN